MKLISHHRGLFHAPAMPSVLLATFGSLCFLALNCPRNCDAVEWDMQPKPLARIPAGTSFVKEPPEGWSNIILFVNGRLASGDVEAASATCHYYASKFNLVWLANVRRRESGSYYLDKVAIGFSTNINGRRTIITSDTQAELGAGLGFIGNSVLSGNEAALGDVLQVARYSTSMLVDAPTVMLHQGDHREMLVRYLIWVSPKNGQVGTTLWLLDRVGPNKDHRIVEDTFQYLPPNMVENRIMNVKGDRFMLGFPSKEAFALVRIPQGVAFEISPEMREVAGRREFTKESYRQLLAAMIGALQKSNSEQR